MRDELASRIMSATPSAFPRGERDTGDAQWFINLVDNYRLDHDYTVFAKVVSGFDVVDRILEGDVMATVRIVPYK
jgi:cyclophilin family peptidyl-prolyl cis-trans isomerase